MYDKLLVPIDGAEMSERAMKASVELARKLGAGITGFIVEPFVKSPVRPGSDQSHMAPWRDSEAQEHARAALQPFEALATQAGVPFSGYSTQTTRVAEGIVDAAREHGCDLIVMATHGRGVLGKLLWGSHTREVLLRSELPVLVVR